MNARFNGLRLRLIVGINRHRSEARSRSRARPGRSEPGRAGPGRAVLPSGWYREYRRNVDQLTAEPGGARDLIGRDARALTGQGQAAPATTRTATRGCRL